MISPQRLSWLLTGTGTALMISALEIAVDWIALTALIGGGVLTFAGIYVRELSLHTFCRGPALQRSLGHGESFTP
jgi:adenosylmethionine-8-amino-7-oxononanoate aminotransferase